MPTHYTIAFAALAGFALGAAAVQAQSRPPVIYVAEIDVTDEAGYLKDFTPKATANVQGAGGRFIVQGGKATALMGDPPKSRIIIQQWDSMEQLQKSLNSPERKALEAIRAKYAKVRAFAVEGTGK